ncbi:MAG: hypothetical protein MK135_13355 [Polyangiaceae bacterium]|nr:hypothetical protein [Polyangiaceae bacterium]
MKLACQRRGLRLSLSLSLLAASACGEEFRSGTPSRDEQQVVQADAPSPDALPEPDPLDQAPQKGIPPQKLASKRLENQAPLKDPGDKPGPLAPRWSSAAPLPLRRGAALNLPRLAVEKAEIRQYEGSLGKHLPFSLELREGTESVGPRLRLVSQTNLNLLGKSVELRARHESAGFIVLWPDQRSYREVPENAVHSLLSERRVDASPFLPLEAEKNAPLPPLQLGERRARLLKNALVEMSWTVKMLPRSGGHLVCRLLMGLVRAQPTPQLCPVDALPLEASLAWREGATLSFELRGRKNIPETADRISRFNFPPALAIYKPGELPPFSLIVEDPSEAERWQGKQDLAQPTLPPSIFVLNQGGFPLLVEVDSSPAFWIFPGAERELHSSKGSLSLRVQQPLARLKAEAIQVKDGQKAAFDGEWTVLDEESQPPSVRNSSP